MARLRIDITSGILEVEGDDALVKGVYEDFKAGTAGIKVAQFGSKAVPSKAKSDDGSGAIPAKAARKKGGETYNYIDFDRELANGLVSFFKEKKPSSALEKNLVFVYYFKKHLDASISPDHIYTAYKLVQQKVPEALNQSLRDTASRKTWISTSNMDDLQLRTPGENYVEHDLPKGD